MYIHWNFFFIKVYWYISQLFTTTEVKALEAFEIVQCWYIWQISNSNKTQTYVLLAIAVQGDTDPNENLDNINLNQSKKMYIDVIIQPYTDKYCGLFSPAQVGAPEDNT